MSIPDIGNLTEEQTRTLAARCLDALAPEERIGVVIEAFDIEGLEELQSWIESELEEAESERPEDDDEETKE